MWHVSDIENILKEHQRIYGAIQRALSSPQLEYAIKSDNATWLQFFLMVMSFIQEPKGMSLNDSHNFASYLKMLFLI